MAPVTGSSPTAAFGVYHRFVDEQLGVVLTVMNTYNKIADPSVSEMVIGATAINWTAVMLVTAVEAYLVDALAECATMDEALMEKSEQKATYGDIRSAVSLDELASDLRRNWARSVVDKGGPKYWMERFTRMGVSDYDRGAGTSLERLWGVRHLIVHNGARATADFIRRHEPENAAVGKAVYLAPTELEPYVAYLNAFVRSTDRMLAGRMFAEGERRSTRSDQERPTQR